MAKTVPLDERSENLSRNATEVVQQLLASKLGREDSFGDSSVKFRFQSGQLVLLVVNDEAVIK